MTELKPCPFCGGEAFIIAGYADAAIAIATCKECEAEITVYAEDFENLYDSYAARHKAIEAWNRRTEDGK